MYWWHIFINSWNGRSFLHLSNPQYTFDWIVQTDASGSLGCRAFLSTQWFQYRWSDEWSTVGIMAKELVPIIRSCAVWGHCLARKTMEFQWGNQSLVAAINKGTPKDTLVMHLLCCLWFFTAIFDIDVTATHIAGMNNDEADLLSRNHIRQFLQHTLKHHSSPHQYLSPY